MKEHKNKILVVLVFVFFISIGLTIAVGFSNQQEPFMLVKSVTPVYDEESSVIVNDDGVIFNDKEQEVKYNVLIENPNNYDVKVSDIKLSTPTEEFLEYDVENLKLDDVISANGTKELVVSFETVKKDGWGRNFEDELIANISFAKVTINDEVTPMPEEDKDDEEKNEENFTDKNEEPEVEEPVQKEEPKDEQKNEAVTIPSDDLVNKVEDNVDNKEEIKEEVKEEQIEETKKEKDETEEKNKEETQNNNGLLIVLISVTGVSGILIIVILVKKKKTKNMILIFALISGMSLVDADELIELPMVFNVSFESQNVMMKAVEKEELCDIDEDDEGNEYVICKEEVYDYNSFWIYHEDISKIYIENEFNEPKVYYEKFDVSEKQDGRVMAYLVTSVENSNYYDLYLQADGIIYPNADASYYFQRMRVLTLIDNMDGLDTSDVTDMSYMFNETGSLCTNFTLDVSNFDTSNVTNMSYMFAEAGRESKIFTLDVSNFDTSNVTDMSYMFYKTALMSSNFTLDVSNFDTSNVTDMSNMFNHVGNANWGNFTLDVSNFDTSNVTNMSYMFAKAGTYSTNFTLDVSNFDTSKVTNMNYMFDGVGFKSTTFTLDVSNFDTSKVTYMANMFYNTGYNSTKLNTSITISNPNPTSYSSMFKNVATKEGAKITVNYTSKTSSLVDKMIATKTIGSNVVKGELVEIITDDIDVGDEIAIANEHFNVISQTDDEITMLAKYNLGTDYRQSITEKSVAFADDIGWGYTPGPKEIDIQKWSSNPKTYVNEYVKYLKEILNVDNVTGDLITLKELGDLGCTVPNDYATGTESWTCVNSSQKDWLINNQFMWTRSAHNEYSHYVWIMIMDGGLFGNAFHSDMPIRPTITISKEALRNYLKS